MNDILTTEELNPYLIAWHREGGCSMSVLLSVNNNLY